jgi:hypothetical protein
VEAEEPVDPDVWYSVTCGRDGGEMWLPLTPLDDSYDSDEDEASHDRLTSTARGTSARLHRPG